MSEQTVKDSRLSFRVSLHISFNNSLLNFFADILSCLSSERYLVLFKATVILGVEVAGRQGRPRIRFCLLFKCSMITNSSPKLKEDKFKIIYIVLFFGH